MKEIVMSTTSFKELTQNTSTHLRTLREGIPEVMQAFAGLSKSALADGALAEKQKELIAYAIAVALRCDDCIGFHAKALVRVGATLDEVREAVGVAVLMGGGPAAMYASHAVAAFQEFSNA